jgi:hypothetical protein
VCATISESTFFRCAAIGITTPIKDCRDLL